jgi:hypothetical protein
MATLLGILTLNQWPVSRYTLLVDANEFSSDHQHSETGEVSFAALGTVEDSYSLSTDKSGSFTVTIKEEEEATLTFKTQPVHFELGGDIPCQFICSYEHGIFDLSLNGIKIPLQEEDERECFIPVNIRITDSVINKFGYQEYKWQALFPFNDPKLFIAESGEKVKIHVSQTNKALAAGLSKSVGGEPDSYLKYGFCFVTHGDGYYYLMENGIIISNKYKYKSGDEFEFELIGNSSANRVSFKRNGLQIASTTQNFQIPLRFDFTLRFPGSTLPFQIINKHITAGYQLGRSIEENFSLDIEKFITSKNIKHIEDYTDTLNHELLSTLKGLKPELAKNEDFDIIANAIIKDRINRTH